MTRRASRVDAVIIGAGAAGLAAARVLSIAGYQAVLIEARARIGGRVYTVRDPRLPLPIELGAEFIHGEVDDTFGIVNAARLLVALLPDNHYRSREGKFGGLSNFWDKMHAVGEAIARQARSGRRDLSFCEALDRLRIASGVREQLLDFVEGFHAAHGEKVSARFFAAGPELSDPRMERQFRVVDGYDRLIQYMRDSLDPSRVTVRLDTAATEIAWSRGEVVVQCRTGAGAEVGPIRGRTAIVTIPHAVFRARSLRFTPAIEDKQRAAERLETGQVFKICLRFRSAFWDEGDFVTRRLTQRDDDPPPIHFVHCRDADLPTWWTAVPFRVPLLTGWAGGPRAERLLSQPESARLDRSLTALARAFAVPRRVLDDGLDGWWMHDWQTDPWSLGAYTYPKVGGINAQSLLAKPLGGTLFFAGEATDPDQTGTVAAAIGSGDRAAHQVIRALG